MMAMKDRAMERGIMAKATMAITLSMTKATRLMKNTATAAKEEEDPMTDMHTCPSPMITWMMATTAKVMAEAVVESPRMINTPSLMMATATTVMVAVMDTSMTMATMQCTMMAMALITTMGTTPMTTTTTEENRTASQGRPAMASLANQAVPNLANQAAPNLANQAVPNLARDPSPDTIMANRTSRTNRITASTPITDTMMLTTTPTMANKSVVSEETPLA
mmetsp:Transcript_4374/g.8110  ORF Transcript_4374/g.8110 Transcript_4374/m.8110 type:complete len:221 (+) Transcript_4374:445-1107(+)